MLKFVSSNSAESSPELIMSIPSSMRNDFLKRFSSLKTSYQFLSDQFRKAAKTIRIFVPYADPSITALMGGCNAQVFVVTTSQMNRRQRGNPVLERIKLNRSMLVRYLVENKKGNSIYQVHAKIFVFDSFSAYVGSANLTDTSLHYNLEAGIIVRESGIISQITTIFDMIFESYAVPVEML